MDDMVERVERTLQALLQSAPEVDIQAGFGALIGLSPDVGEAWLRSVARAVIKTLREPTPQMTQAAEQMDHLFGRPVVALPHADAWAAMIDAALASNPSPPA